MCIRDSIKTKTVTYNWHDSDTSFLEAVLARGDRRMGKVLETAWRKGAHLDAWEEYFSLDRWLEAFDECGLDPHFYANPVSYTHLPPSRRWGRRPSPAGRRRR